MPLSVVDSGGVSTIANTVATFTTTAAWAADDLVLFFVVTNQTTFSPPTPTGYTLGGSIVVSTSMTNWWYWKWAAGTEASASSQGFTAGQWTVSAAKGLAWVVVRGVTKATFAAMTNVQRFATTSLVNGTSETVPTIAVSSGSMAAVSAWGARSSAPDTTSTLVAPSGYTQSTNLTFRTGSGVSMGVPAWDLTTHTDTVGSGAWTNSGGGGGGVSLVTVALPTAASTTRVTKTNTTSWNVKTRVIKTIAISWNVAGVTTRITKTVAISWNLKSAISEAVYPAYIAHRGGRPEPEETMTAYNARWAANPFFWHEGDTQVLADGLTLVANHDDTVDRLYSSGPVATGNVSTLTGSQWDSEFWHVNSGYTGADAQAMRISTWVAAYGPSSNKPVIGIWENKVGTPIARTIAAFAGMQGQVIINGFTLSDVQAAVAAGFQGCYQYNTGAVSPDWATLAASGIKFISLEMGSVTSGICTSAHSNGIKVLVYTVNSTGNRDSMLALGADGFFSDKPQAVYGLTRFTKTVAMSWNVKTRATKTNAVSWNIKTRVTKTNVMSWSIKTRVTGTVPVLWNIKTRVIKTNALSWNIKTRVVNTTPVVWNVLVRVIKTSAASWNVTQRGAATVPFTWNVRQRIVTTRAFSWNVVGATARVTMTNPVFWNVKARIIKTNTASWNVRTRVVKTNTTFWNVRTRVVKTNQASWNVNSRVVRTTVVSWSVKTRVLKTSTVSWNVRTRGTKTGFVSWITRARVIKTQSVSWKVSSTSSTPFGTITINGQLYSLSHYVIRGATKVPVQSIYLIQDGQKIPIVMSGV